jgi:hypothetical protein
VLEGKYAKMAMRCAALDWAKKRFENIQKAAEKETGSKSQVEDCER